MDKLTGSEVRFMSIAKALGIIAVVVGHSGSPLKPYVYLYHLALFYFISGYFFRDEYVHALFTLIKKRVKSLYLPYIFYQFLFLLLHNVLLQISIYSYRDNYLYTWQDFSKNAFKILIFLGDSEQLPSMLWFLSSLFFVNILFYIIRFGSTYFGKRESFTSITVVLIFFLCVGAHNPTHYVKTIANVIGVALIIYYAGYLYRRVEQRIPLHWALALAATALLIVSAQYGEIELSRNQFGGAEFFLVSSFLGIYANIYIAKHLTRTAWSNGLVYIGNSTIVIMALHPLSFKAIHLVQIYYNSYPLWYLAAFPILNGASGWWIAYSFLGIFIPLMAKYCVENVVGFSARIGKTLLTRTRA